MENLNHDFPLSTLKPWKRLVLQITKPSWEIVALGFVPSSQFIFLNYDGWKFKWLIKYLKRKLFIKITGQDKFILESIPKGARRLLWINLSAPSLGDSIMDLSGRAVLSEFQVDLLTDKKNAALYEKDQTFRHVFSEVVDARNAHLLEPYDLIIVDAFSPKIIKIKRRIAPYASFVGMWGFLNGFEVHRTIYSYKRIQWLLRAHTFVTKPILPSMTVSGSSLFKNKSKKPSIAFVVGAEWAFRRYNQWPAVISQLIDDYQIVLIGSSNGTKDANEIISKFTSSHNFVDKCSLSETALIISEVNFVIAADGGLWNIASALGKPSVALFASTFIYDEKNIRINRDTPDMICETLYDEHQVSNIDPKEIITAFHRLLKRI
ncbi:MAG: glycosyltransferase family 9 protein [Bacteroidota bacterium]